MYLNKASCEIIFVSWELLNFYVYSVVTIVTLLHLLHHLKRKQCLVIYTKYTLGKIRHKNVIRRHDETRRRNDLGNWLYMKVSRTSFYVGTFSRRFDNVVYVAMSRFYDVRDVKRRPENFHIQPNIQVLRRRVSTGDVLPSGQLIAQKHFASVYENFILKIHCLLWKKPKNNWDSMFTLE